MFYGNPEQIIAGIATEIIVEKNLIMSKDYQKKVLVEKNFWQRFGNGKKFLEIKLLIN